MKNTLFVALVAVVLTVPLSYAGYGAGKKSSKKTTTHEQFNELYQGTGDYEDNYQLNLPEDEEVEGEAATAHDSNPVGMVQQNSGYGFEEGIARY